MSQRDLGQRELDRVPWAYFREFGGALVLYMAALPVTDALRDDMTNRSLAIAIELLPVIPLLLGFWAIMRQINRMDELQRRIQSEAIALAAILLGLAMMIYGFLENAGMPRLPVIWVTPFLIGLWGLCMPFVWRKYR